MSTRVDTTGLPTPPLGWRWEYEVQEHYGGKAQTAWLRLFDDDDRLRQRGQVALEMYGIEGVHEKALWMVKRAAS